MDFNEDDVRSFAKFWSEENWSNLLKGVDMVLELTDKLLANEPRDGDGKVKDQYLQGLRDGQAALAQGLKDARTKAAESFDEVFDYAMYRWAKKEKAGV